VTADESWFMLEYEHEAQWAVSREKVAPRVRPNFQSPKFMFRIIWGIAGFHVTNLMSSQRSFNSEYFINEIMQPMIAKLLPMGRIPHTHRLIVHLDNCRLHFSKHSQKFFDDNSLLRLPEPSYSPDIAPSDFWLFGHLRSALNGSKFEGPDELLQRIHDFLNEVQGSELMMVFQHWIERVRLVIEHDGDYYQD
jgi:histone-lysine N-methyltransferase SETMAR